MLDELNNYDWEEAFVYASKPDAVPPGSNISDEGFSREDVVEIIAMEDGEHDGEDWIGVFLLEDGRYTALRAGCDYTGWDCHAGGSADVAATLADIIRFGLSPQERERLDLEMEEADADGC